METSRGLEREIENKINLHGRINLFILLKEKHLPNPFGVIPLFARGFTTQ